MNRKYVDSPNWIQDVNKLFAKNEGCFISNELSNQKWVIEWKKVNPCSEHLNEKIKSMSPLLINAYSKIEIEFAKKFPELVKDEMLLKSLAPLFEKGVDNVDWERVDHQLKEVLNHFFNETDWKQFSKKDDIQIFAVIKEKNTDHALGIIQFLLSPDYGDHNIKIGLYDGVKPFSDYELNKLLISSIFKLIPDVKRIFFHTRITNESAVQEHEKLGFTKTTGPLPHWIDMEYKVESNNYLQSTSNSLTEI